MTCKINARSSRSVNNYINKRIRPVTKIVEVQLGMAVCTYGAAFPFSQSGHDASVGSLPQRRHRAALMHESRVELCVTSSAHSCVNSPVLARTIQASVMCWLLDWANSGLIMGV